MYEHYLYIVVDSVMIKYDLTATLLLVSQKHSLSYYVGIRHVIYQTRVIKTIKTQLTEKLGKYSQNQPL